MYFRDFLGAFYEGLGTKLWHIFISLIVDEYLQMCPCTIKDAELLKVHCIIESTVIPQKIQVCQRFSYLLDLGNLDIILTYPIFSLLSLRELSSIYLACAGISYTFQICTGLV